MNKFKFYYLFSFLTLGLFMTSCGDDDDGANQVTITVEEPLDGETISDCSAVHVHIDFEATVENHEVEIVLHPEGDVEDKIIDYDEHAHDQVISFEQDIDLCAYSSGTCFHLEVSACVDHDCAETSTADVEFCLQ